MVDVLLAPPTTRRPDSTAPYNVSRLVLVTGASSGFFDRMRNMVGSLHVWEPHQRLLVYDLGFSQRQVAEMLCWRNVEVLPFPFADYPAHVADVTNYAFKALVIKEALKGNDAVLWIDSGLELRAPIDTLRTALSHDGHVAALQEDAIGEPMYTMTRPMAQWFGLGSDAQWRDVAQVQFCAGGLQGFVRGSDAEALVLQRVVDCSLDVDTCLAPPGSSRANHNFDQTAFTLAIWAANFTCLPRETHCMWSVKKAARDPTALSTPIEIISRGHRLPKPYVRYVQRTPGCDKVVQSWSQRRVAKESTSRKGIMFTLTRVYLQYVGDLIIQSAACPTTYPAAMATFWALTFSAGGCCMGAVCTASAAYVPGASALRRSWSGAGPLTVAAHLAAASVVVAAAQMALLRWASNVR
ncbi:hypothetical protein FOA52_005563 [Chlamydomonas sp. UWO 241]|nr:hypothetical protein FOA52_007230 [Chlamydomonas sp. UWO 241]KAG1656537.1 hypothetical protein FOA52_005563 [Chlamydomonas sp. UWO 241]